MDDKEFETVTLRELIQASLVGIWVLLCLFRDARLGEEWRIQDEGYEEENTEEGESEYVGPENEESDEESGEESEEESEYKSEDDKEVVQEEVSQSEGSGEESSEEECSEEDGSEDDQTEPVPPFPSPELQEALLAEAARVEDWERNLRWQNGYTFPRAQPCPCGTSSCHKREGAQRYDAPRPADHLWPGFHRKGDHWEHRGTWGG